MFVINDYVNRKDTTHPTGIVKDVKDGVILVNWGRADGFDYEEEFSEEELQLVEHTVYSPDEVIKRHLETSGANFREIKD